MLPSASQFLQRTDPSQLPEWMDEPCSYEDFRDCLIDLESVNRLLFSYKPIVSWIARQAKSQSRSLHIVDVGCGGGGLLRHIAAWAKQNNIAVELTGVDLNPMSTRAAAELSSAHPEIEWLTCSAQSLPQSAPIDIVTSSLCTHHMSNPEIIDQLRWMDTTARRGWFISDLRRSRINYALFSNLSRLAGWHRFVQHDGPVSIQRSFTEHDWNLLCTVAGITNVKLKSGFPGKICVSKTHS